MKGWRERTEAELRGAREALDSLAGSVVGEPTPAQMDALWNAYVVVETAVVTVKLDAAEESPGRFVNTKPYAVPDERQALRFAATALASAESALRSREETAALKQLRESRNYLRMLLRRKRLASDRSARSSG